MSPRGPSKLRLVERCPLCGSQKRTQDSVPEHNLYSEKLSEQFACDPRGLLQQMYNVQCQSCGLIYKQKWFPRESLKALFSNQVPTHPKGWDVLSGRFSPDNFQAETTVYEQALEQNDRARINRYRRALSSIIESIAELEQTKARSELLEAIDSGDIGALRDAAPVLRRVMSEPAPYRRFSGFSAQGLWHYMDSTLNGLNSWAEVGCPLWGLLSRARQNGVDATYLNRSEPNYWATGCRNNGTQCVEHLVQSTGANTSEWSDEPHKPWDCIGVFQYLDHLERPAEFMAQLFEKSSAAAIILDDMEQPVYIQHFTGWTESAIAWLAERHGCRVHDDFDEIRPSGNRLFLLERP